ncbi:MAG: phosphoribosylanthranilate isomerase [Candidatus Marinimicrobia bacterium]|nr:phosphoribosylanthranilate isomerase [Candidatus Neomarinimicrobiota bacterium]
MPVKLKICGITTLADAQMAVELGVDWLGFNFYPKSPRYIDPLKAAEIIKKLPDHIQSIGILVQPTLSEINEIIQIAQIQRLQIYEPMDFSDLSILPIPSIICHRISDNQNKSYDFMNADMILLDNHSKNAFGGTGKAFDWANIPANIPRDKLILTGGITPQNISQALETVDPAVIDVASGSELSPGKKDHDKIKILVEKVREFNRK